MLDGSSPLACEALTALSKKGWPVTQARAHVRPVPGLYAIYGDAEAWSDLGLDPQQGRALYVGKSEDDLVRRELDTHFAADPTKKTRTGSSTVRRSLAALLRDTLNLHAVPRNPDNPGHFSKYGLTPDGDARLTAWMHERLSLTVWERPVRITQPLLDIEVAIIHHWIPPLNIKDNPRPLPRLRLAREAMTREASRSHDDQDSMTGIRTPTLAPPPTPPESIPIRTAEASGLTPVELARELNRSPKTIRQALRDRYGRLPLKGDRWGVLAPEKQNYLRDRFR
jgi:hypothetical protein